MVERGLGVIGNWVVVGICYDVLFIFEEVIDSFLLVVIVWLRIYIFFFYFIFDKIFCLVV